MLKSTILATATSALILSGVPAMADASKKSADLPVSSYNMFGSPAVDEILEGGYIVPRNGQILVSTFIGQTVYESDLPDAAAVGDLNDLITGPDGKIEAAIIGVGGFLGVGEKNVAVSPDQLQLAQRSDGKIWLVVKLSKDRLLEAPEFDKSTLFRDGVARSPGGEPLTPKPDGQTPDDPTIKVVPQ